VYGSTTDLEGMANVMSLMNFSSLANECQNSHFPFSGSSNVNSPGNTCNGNQFRLYSVLGEVQRVATNLLAQMDAGTLDLGNTIAATDQRNIRARSFAEFLRGISLGYVAMMHDSGAITSPKMGTSAADCVPDALTGVCIGALRYYTEVMDSAYAALQRSIDYANTPIATMTGGNGFPLPATWLAICTPTATNTTVGCAPGGISNTQFVQIIRSFRARLRANVARTPAERAAVDWTSVIADVQNGIPTDMMQVTSTTVGPTNSWRNQYESFTTWHQMPPFIIGMADTSGAYNIWLNTPLGDRGAGNTGFFMKSGDLRFPQGATRATQQADLVISTCNVSQTPCKRYFANRTAANDQFSGPGWGWSNYDFVRFHSWNGKGDANSARNGSTTEFTLAELNLLRAEGEYRKGNFATACALVNISRNAGSGQPYLMGGGLPLIVTCDATTPVPGTAGPQGTCVPKAPIGAGNTLVCGTLWEALKYEKRIETAYTAYTPWYLDERGWGDLPENTALFWAIPYQELQARGRPISALYGAGVGVGNAPNSVAAKGTYGW
jgi:hypothetical protein